MPMGRSLSPLQDSNVLGSYEAGMFQSQPISVDINNVSVRAYRRA